MRSLSRISAVVAILLVACGTAQAQPVYNIVDLGLLAGDSNSQGFGISPDGTFATGRSVTGNFTATRAFSWTQGGGMTALPNLGSPSRPFGVGNSVNNSGVVVGTGSTTSFGSSRLPLIWQGGVVSQLPLPSGQTLGQATGINGSGVAVGSANSGSAERGAIYQGGVGSFITTTTATGCFITVANGINNAGLVVGNGIDPNNAARNVGFLYNSVSNTATEVGLTRAQRCARLRRQQRRLCRRFEHAESRFGHALYLVADQRHHADSFCPGHEPRQRYAASTRTAGSSARTRRRSRSPFSSTGRTRIGSAI